MPTPHIYQRAGVDAALASAGRRWIFNDETGLGKTAQAIIGAHEPGADRALIFCPAAVRYNWRDELDKWWPGHPEVGVIFAGERKQMSKAKRAELEKAQAAPIQIWSYSMANRFAAAAQFSGAPVILDELHTLQTPKAQWSKAIRGIIHVVRPISVYGLTATLMPNKPLDAWNALDTLCPGRFGEARAQGSAPNWKFCQRYTNPVHNGYGWTFKGVAPDTAPELARRIAAMSSRATKKEYGHLLPPFTVRQWTQEVGTVPSQAAVSWVQDAENEATHMAVLTHRRRTARDIAAMLAQLGHRVICLTGEDSADARREALAGLKASPGGVLVATMHSVGLGIDLTWCTRALFAELYARPETIIQALGRFSRLSGSAPSLVDLLVIFGDVSEKLAWLLKDKLEAITAVTAASHSETLLTTAFGDVSDIDLAASLRAAVLSADLDDVMFYSDSEEDEDD